MRRSVLSRIEKIEQNPKTQEARRQHIKRQAWNGFIENTMRLIRRAIIVHQYIGTDETISSMVDDYLEETIAIQMNLFANYPIKPGESWTAEVFNTARDQVIIETTRRWYGRTVTVEELEREFEQAQQLGRDIDSGVPREQSEAAEFFRRLHRQYPRLNHNYLFLPKFKPEGWTWRG
jgi:hypothetical protein